jgi:hypothetical protein
VSVRRAPTAVLALLGLAAALPALAQRRALLVSSTDQSSIEARENLRPLLEARGYTVNTAFTPGNLAPYTCAFDLRPFDPLSFPDRSAYLGLLERGGGVMLAGENVGCCFSRDQSIGDFLRLDAQGGTVDIDLVRDINCGLPGCEADYVQDAVPGHPVTTTPAPIGRVSWDGFGAGVFTDVGSGDRLTPDTVLFPSPPGPQIVAAAWSAGDLAAAATGRAVVTLDINWLTNLTFGRTDNRPFADNMVAFLCPADDFQVAITSPADGFRLECPATPDLEGTVESLDPTQPAEIVTLGHSLNGGPPAPPSVITPPLPALTTVSFREAALPLVLGANTVRVEALAATGVIAQASVSGVVVDTLPPTIDPPSCQDATIPLDGACQATYATPVAAVDACDATVTLSSVPPLPVVFTAPGSTDIVYTASDDAGNASSCTRRVTAVDVTPPAIACPGPLTLECTAAGGVPASDPLAFAWLASVVASDNCTRPPAVGHDAPALFPAGCAPGRATTVTFTATDTVPLSASCASDLTVVDTLAPDLSGCALTPWDLVLGGPRPPLPPASATSSCLSSAAFRVDCGLAPDLCASEPVGRTAAIVAERTDVVDGACLPVSESVPVDCDEVVELRLVAPPCPARPPRSPLSALSVTSAGVKVIRAERLELQVRAADACGNTSAPCAVDPLAAEDPTRPGATLLCPPKPPRCPRSPCP